MASKKGKKEREKRLQKRAEKKRAQEKESKMERQHDLNYVNKQLEDLNTELQGVNAKFTEYSRKVDEIIQGFLKKAGVLEQFQKLNLERDGVRQQAQEKVNALQAKMRELQGVRSFLIERAAEAGPTPPEDLEEEIPTKTPPGNKSDDDEHEEEPEVTGPPKPEF